MVPTGLQSIPGIGPHIASAIVSSIGKGHSFESARCFAVWTGLTPIQKASGFKSVMSASQAGMGILENCL
ncbi:MAG: IS110 family transposase [Oceanospirillaceae bacterium]|nr:IS110 family transposase [Oceanospirillaceae bacterium]